MMVQNVVFDMAGVLIEPSFANMEARFVPDEADRALVHRELFQSVAWVQMDRGVRTVEEAAAAACKQLPARLHGCVDAIARHWHTEVRWIPGMDALIQRLKRAGYGVYMLSNTAKTCHRLYDKLPAPDCFDGRLISADCHLLKPEPAIFHLFCDTFGLAPGSCVFIDDAAANVEGAIHIGMRGVVFRGDANRLERELDALGVRLP